MHMQDPKRRILETINALNEWYKRIPELNVVLCDGSGFDWESEVKAVFSDKNIEFLSHVNDRAMVAKWGGGYGESQTINYALEKSRYINDAGCFMKCTGKYWVENITKFNLSKFKGSFKCKGVFVINKWKLLYINTVFYISDISTYKKLFSEVYLEIDDHSGKSIEVVMSEILIRKKIKGYQLSVIPRLLGWSAHVDEPLKLDNSFRNSLRNIKYKLLSFIL